MHKKRLLIILTAILLATAASVAAFTVYDRTQHKTETKQQMTKEKALAEHPEVKTPPSPEAEKVAGLYGKTTIFINESMFGPGEVTVKTGSPVEWTNLEKSTHQVVTDDGTTITAAQSPVLERGQSFSYTFTKAGTYKYHDKLHTKLTGTITVAD